MTDPAAPTTPRAKLAQTVLSSFGAAGTILLATFTFLDEQAQERSKLERNERQAAICDSVNRSNDVMAILVREATVPPPNATQDEIRRSQQYKDQSLAEIDKARCRVSDVE